MGKKCFHEAPAKEVVDVKFEGVVCSSTSSKSLKPDDFDDGGDPLTN